MAADWSRVPGRKEQEVVGGRLITPAASKDTSSGGAIRWDDVKDEKANRGVAENGGDKLKTTGMLVAATRSRRKRPLRRRETWA